MSREAEALHKAYELLRDEVRQNVREGCEFAVASANDALDEAKTELSRLANGAPGDATSVGAGLSRNIAALVDARCASISEAKVARAATALSEELRDVEGRCSSAVEAARADAATALETTTKKYEATTELQASTATKAMSQAVRKCAAEAKQAADDAREATERVVLAAVAEARRAAERDAERLSRELRAVDARGAAAAVARGVLPFVVSRRWHTFTAW